MNIVKRPPKHSTRSICANKLPLSRGFSARAFHIDIPKE